jgi:DNA modification methylase
VSGEKPYWSSPDGSIVLHHGDARDVLPRLPQGRDGFDLLLTDPPYGVNATVTGMRKKQLALGHVTNDGDTSVAWEVLPLAWRTLRFNRHAYVFGPFDLSTLPHATSVCELVWDKCIHNAGDLAIPWGSSHEPIQFAVRRDGPEGSKQGGLVARMRRGSVLRHQRPTASGVKHHVTEKPIPLLRELIESSSLFDDVVLDPFSGSCSTLVAALIEGRRAVGIEIERAWCDVAVGRLEALTAQGQLFGGAESTPPLRARGGR